MLIAKVHVKVWVGGAVKVFAPGEEVTDLTAHDETELVKCGALQDTVEERMASRQAQRTENLAADEFLREREAVLAAQESRGAAAPAQVDNASPGGDAPNPTGTETTGTAIDPVVTKPTQAVKTPAGIKAKR